METLSDTRPEITALQYRMLRQASPARKLAMLGEMNLTVKTLMYSGLRSRYPSESAEKLRRRLADLILGAELAHRVYGPLVD
jgi:cystathionine beta-lyase/cystathionine gamma-synthase